MLREVKQMLWRGSAVCLGAALPLVLVGRSVTAALLFGGIILGLMATKGESLRATVRLMLDSWVVLLVLGFLGASLASSYYGVVPLVSLDKWFQLVGVAVASGLLFMVLREMPGVHVEKLMKAMAVALYAMAALAVLDVLTGYERLAMVLHDIEKAHSAYRLNFYSAVLAVLLPLVWARLLVKAREFEPFATRVLWPAVGFGMFAVVVCGGRAGWVAAMVAFFGFWLLVTRWHGVVLHARQWFGAVAWVALAMAAYGWMHGWGFMSERVLMVTEGGRGMLSGRLDIWTQVAGWIPHSPWLGLGPMAYRYVPGALDAHPHNWVLQMLLEVGLVGTSVFAAMILLVLLRFLGLARVGIYGVGALAGLVAFLTASLANTSIFNIWWLTFLPVVAMVGWRIAWAPKDERRRGRDKAKVVRGRELLKGGHGSA